MLRWELAYPQFWFTTLKRLGLSRARLGKAIFNFPAVDLPHFKLQANLDILKPWL